MKGSISTRILGILGIVGILALVSQDYAWAHTKLFDVKAALLVFVTPWFVLLAFRKDQISLGNLLGRVRESRRLRNDVLLAELVSLTNQLDKGGVRSDIVKMSETNGDSFVRYCAGLYSSKFAPQELATLMQQKLDKEDETWQGLNLVFGFLAKMAPYFGMLATVIGMISLLKNMQDFSKISSGMALALQGTLYGLVSFTLMYSPLQKWCNGFREWLYRRNSMVAHWFLMVSEQREPALIRAQLEIESESK